MASPDFFVFHSDTRFTMESFHRHVAEQCETQEASRKEQRAKIYFTWSMEMFNQNKMKIKV